MEVTDEAITARLVDGRVISVPLAWSWGAEDKAAFPRRLIVENEQAIIGAWHEPLKP